jgi:hypothetical protein
MPIGEDAWSVSELSERGELCNGAGVVASKERRIFSAESVTGVCSACGGRFELGHRSVIPEHTTKPETSPRDEPTARVH